MYVCKHIILIAMDHCKCFNLHWCRCCVLIWHAYLSLSFIGGVCDSPLPIYPHACLAYSRSNTSRCDGRHQILFNSKLRENPTFKCRSYPFVTSTVYTLLQFY